MSHLSLAGKQLLYRLIALAVLVAPSVAVAEALVLVHGYLGEGASWRISGVAAALERAGWRDAGNVTYVAGSVRMRDAEPGAERRSLYTVDLPAAAPLRTQSERLAAYLQRIAQRHRGEQLILVGHSAGGLVARLTMVQHPELSVSALITIATPHLGTDTAELGLMTSLSPLGLFAPLFGAELLNESRGLYADLVRARPGTILFWLNQQRHPDARYISIVRTSDEIGLGALIVPAYSQDMNHVFALRGRAKTVHAGSEHGLTSADGDLLVRLLRELFASGQRAQEPGRQGTGFASIYVADTLSPVGQPA